MSEAGLQKAKIKVYRTPVEEIACLFNPADYKISASTGYAKKNQVQSSSSPEQYVGGFKSTLNLTLYYDLTENMGGNTVPDTKTSARDYTGEIERLLLVEGSLHKPPQIEFIWGDLAYKGSLSSLNQEFNYFGLDGKPLRAKLDLTIDAADNADAEQENPKESPDRTKSRMVMEGITLWRLAWEEYGDCNKWVEIARYNQLMNPMDISPGQMLKLPALPQ